jgi:tRNA (Uracil-5-)-methyltransferase
MSRCDVLPPHVSALLLPLRDLIASMNQRDRVPQIELAVGDEVTALVLRHLEPLPEADLDRLRAFGAERGVQWWLQAKGPDTVHRLDEGGPELAYALPEFGIVMPFRPTDFTQVNPHINRVLVTRSLRLLEVRVDERVIDWFCGIGNFTLPLATQAREVLGIEGSEALVQRARDNATLNGQGAKTRFVARDLFEMTPADLANDGHADKWLIDPPREGAFALTTGRTARRPIACAGLCAAEAHRLRQLQPGDPRSRRRAAGSPGRLPLHGGGGGQHVSAHGPRREHCRLRSRPINEQGPKGALLKPAKPRPPKRQINRGCRRRCRGSTTATGRCCKDSSRPTAWR